MGATARTACFLACQYIAMDFLDEDWEPPKERQEAVCPWCKAIVAPKYSDEYRGVRCDDSYWVVEHPDDDHYTGYCNEMHYLATHKEGVFSATEDEPMEALSLD